MITGQLLYYVPNATRTGRITELRVKHVGRKWATLELPLLPGAREWGRCDLVTGEVDGKGYSSPGKCWNSKEEYERYAQLAQAWTVFRNRIDRAFNPPAGVTIEKLESVLDTLNLGLWKGSQSGEE
jgi:hypothetical protein